MKACRAWMVALGVLAAPPAGLSAEALAQGARRPPSRLDPKMAEAKRLFDQGAELYAKGDYEGAIAAWEQSFELSKKPLIFESIANAYERLGQHPRALEYLAKWRKAAPKGEHALLDERIHNLEARIARDRAEAEAARRSAEERERREAVSKRIAAEKAAREAEERRAAHSRVPGLLLIGVGATAVAVGVTLDVVAAASRPDPASSCAASGDRQVCLASAQVDIESANTLATAGDVTWIAGGAMVAGGVVWLLVGPRSSSNASASATASGLGPRAAEGRGLRALPIVGPGRTGLVLRAAF